MVSYPIPPPESMKCSGDLTKNWAIFREAFSDYATTIELNKKDDEIQVATLKSVMGKDCKQVLKQLELSVEQLKNPDTILEKLQQYFSPKRTILYV